MEVSLFLLKCELHYLDLPTLQYLVYTLHHMHFLHVIDKQPYYQCHVEDLGDRTVPCMDHVSNKYAVRGPTSTSPLCWQASILCLLRRNIVISHTYIQTGGCDRLTNCLTD